MAKLNDNERIREILKNYGITDENRITDIFKELEKEERKEIYLEFSQSDDSYKKFEEKSFISESTIRRFVRLFSKDGKSENRLRFEKIISEIYDLEFSPKKEIKIKDEIIKENNKFLWFLFKVIVGGVIFIVFVYGVTYLVLPRL